MKVLKIGIPIEHLSLFISMLDKAASVCSPQEKGVILATLNGIRSAIHEDMLREAPMGVAQ